MHELIAPNSAIDPLVTSQSGVCCKRTSGEAPVCTDVAWFSEHPMLVVLQ